MSRSRVQRAIGVLLVACLVLLGACRLFPPVQAPFDPHRDLSGDLPVFPGAEGFGTSTIAGRGGSVIRVTTLADSGPGSLREALSAEGPRVVVFEVGGIVSLASEIVVRSPFLTVAGRSRRGSGS